MEFIGRENELSILESQYSNQDHPFVIIKGRRRVGKSKLIREFIKDKDAFYFQVNKEEPQPILDSFSEKLSRMYGTAISGISSWTAAIELYVKLSGEGRRILVLDEFQYIVKADKNSLCEFQAIWDHILSEEDIMFIISGSYKTMMDKITEYDEPLYGRNTCDLRLRPLEFRDCMRGADYRYSVEEYAFTGGVPHYMQLIDRKRSVIENIEALTMRPGAPLMNEVPYLMSEEFSDLKSYNTYLKTIASGNRKMEDICSRLRIKSNEVSPYISKLIGSDILERRAPITEVAEKSRNGQYVISDNFVSFWFRFVYPHREDITVGENDEAFVDLEGQYIVGHTAFVFEDISRTELRRYLRSKGVAASYGSYWDGTMDIDVVAVDRKNKTVYAAECKYWNSPVGLNVLNELRAKISKVRQFNDMKVIPCIFSASGYTENIIENADDAILFNDGERVN